MSDTENSSIGLLIRELKSEYGDKSLFDRPHKWVETIVMSPDPLYDIPADDLQVTLTVTFDQQSVMGQLSDPQSTHTVPLSGLSKLMDEDIDCKEKLTGIISEATTILTDARHTRAQKIAYIRDHGHKVAKPFTALRRLKIAPI